MKRIIEGKVYNSETADCIAEWSNQYYPGDFHYCEESLYRTKKGSWFVAGSGGALSKYAVPVGNNGSSGGEGLEPISAESAQAWLENRDFTDQLEQYFSDLLEEA